MASEAPACPGCGSEVQPDWDWCHHCGYDPEGLRPEPAGATAATAATASGTTATVMAPAPTMAPALVPPLTKPRGPATIETLRDTSTVTPEPARGLGGLREALGRERKPNKKDRSARPTVPGQEVTFQVPPTPAMRGVAALLFLVAAFLGFATISGVMDIAKGGGTLNRIADVVFIMICAVLAFVVVVQGAALVRMRIVLTPTELVAYNRFGRVHRVPRGEIRSIRMSERDYDLLGSTLSKPIDVPYLQKADGDGFWLDALGGRSPRTPPTAEQGKMLEKLSATLGLAPVA
jgi:hypothetical protein